MMRWTTHADFDAAPFVSGPQAVVDGKPAANQHKHDGRREVAVRNVITLQQDGGGKDERQQNGGVRLARV